MRSYLTNLLAAICLMIPFILDGQVDFELIGEFEPCSEGCYTYFIESEEPGFELNVQNHVEPIPNSHIIDYIWTQQELGFTICYEVPGTYVFSYFVYFDEIYQDSFVVNVGQSYPLTIAEREPCEIDAFVACKGSTKTYYVEEVDSFGNVFGFWDVYGASNFTVNADGSVTVTWGNEDYGQLYYGVENPGNCFGETEQRVKLIDNPESKFAIENQKTKYCQGEDIYLLNQSINAGSFYWDFGDGTTSQDVQPVKAYDFPGDYIISLVAEGDCGCTDVYAIEVTIEDLWMPQIDCKGTICENTTVTYTSIEDCGIFNWTVSPNGKIIDGGTNNENFITIEWQNGPEGTIDLVVDACSAEMCPTPAKYIIPIVSDQAPIVGNVTPCFGSTETYTVTDFGASDYVWNVSGGTLLTNGNDNSVMVYWDSNSSGSIGVSYNNCYLECGGSSSINTIVTESFELSGNDKFCASENIEIQAIESSSSNPASVDWLLLNESEVLIENQLNTNQFTFSPSGLNGTFHLIAQSDNYCNKADTTSLIITPISSTPDEIEGETAICIGNTYAYKAVTSLTNASFKWLINDGSVATEMNGSTILYQWNTTGPYELKLAQRNNNGDWCYSDYITIPIQEVTDLSFDGNAAPCQDETAIYTATPYQGLDYTWSINPPSAGNIITEQGKNTVEIQWIVPGNHKVILTACGNTDEIDVEVSPKPVITLDFEERVCYNKTTQVTLAESFDSYDWMNESGSSVSALQNPELLPGTYLIKVIDDKGCQQQENFTIKELPKPEIHISTPDSTGVCEADMPGYPTLHAVTSEKGYAYEWHESSTSLGETGDKFSTKGLGKYQVLVTDQNGCTAFSNTINVFNFCGGCSGGPGTPTTCNYPQDCESDTGEVKFSFTAGANCRTFDFKNESVNITPGTVNWNFEDWKSGASNTSTLDNPTHTFSDAGYYVVSLIAEVEDKNNPGGYCRQWYGEVVTVPIKAYFASISACPGAPIEMIDRSTYLPDHPIVSWEWNFGDPTSSDNISFDSNPYHTYNTPGNYEVQLVVGNGTCTDTFTREITVHELPNSTIDLTVSKCEDIAGTFNLIPGDSLAKASWDFGDPTSLEKNTSSVFPSYHTFKNVGMYTVSASMENIFGCEANTNSIIEIFENKLDGDIESSEGGVICENTSTTLSIPSGQAVSWNWQDTSDLSTLEVTEAGIYQVTISDVNYCTYAPDPYQIEVEPAPRVGIRLETFSGDESTQLDGIDVQICEGENLRVIADSNPDYTYSWSNGMITSTLSFDDDAGNLLSAGLTTLEVTIVDNLTGCSYTSSTVTIDVLPNPSNTQIVADQSGILCGGESHELKVDNPVSGVDYYWNTGKKSTILQTNGGGIFWVRAINDNGCTSISNEIVILDGPDMDHAPSGCFVRCNPDTICMPSIPTADSYQWYYEGSPVDAAQNGDMTDLIALNSGSYHLEATDINGCTNTSEPLVLTLQDAIGVLTGTLYEDVDSDGTINMGDVVRGGVNITLSNGWTTTTEPDGTFKFIDLPAGNYSVEVDTTGLGGFIDVFDAVVFDVVTCDDEIDVELLIQKNCEPMRLADREEHICKGDEIIIEGTAYHTEGEFVVYKTNNAGCVDSFNLSITQSKNVTLALTTETACANSDNGSILCDLEDGAGLYSFELNNGVASNLDGQFTNVEAGTHEINVYDDANCMVASGTIDVELTAPIEYEITEKNWDCEEANFGPTIELISGDENLIQVKWSNGNEGFTGAYFEPGWHSVIVANECESIEEEFYVERTYQEIDIDLPNVFSPNDDGVNEEFKIALEQVKAPKVLSFVISDRMGRVIYNYKYNALNAPSWDGKRLNGDYMPVGVYFYHIELEHDVCGYLRRETLAGDVTIIR